MISKYAPMGWNSWDCYGPAVDEETVRKNAEFMADNLKKFGWQYIVVDIQWYEPAANNHEYNAFAELCMDEYSRLIPAENRFPSSAGGKGFAPLAEYVHSLGLKFGIHIMRGIPRQAVHRNAKLFGCDKTARDIAKTDSICKWNTDMYGVNHEADGAKQYYDSIFRMYAEWGVDFIKCDDIAREMPHEQSELIMISEAIKNCGRDMIFSISPGPAPLDKAELFKQTADMWRITDDFWDDWQLLYNMFERTEKWCTHSGAGHWPDADMLPIGPIKQDYDRSIRTQFTENEQITMLTLWSIFRSPLMIGGDMTGFDDFTVSLVTNENILRMHQMSRHAHQVWRKDIGGTEHILWTAASADGGQYIAVFNVGERSSDISLSLADAEIEGQVQATELWSGECFAADGVICVSLPSHGAKAYKIENR